MTYPENIRAAFREVALGLMEWREPATIREQLDTLVIPEGGAHSFGAKWVPYDPQGEVEPFDVQADWEERGI